jgi:hypothetical protein
MRLLLDAGLVTIALVIGFIVYRDGVEKAGYEIGAFTRQVSAGWHGDKFEQKAQ